MQPLHRRAQRPASQLVGLRLNEAFPEIDTPVWRAMLEKVWNTGTALQTVWHDQPYLILLDRQGDVPMLQASLLYRFELDDQRLFGLAIFDNSRAAKNTPCSTRRYAPSSTSMTN